jgi:hypothetical protein
MITFSCEIKLKKTSDMYVLYTEIGVIDGYTKNVDDLFNIKTNESRSINKLFPSIFGTMSRTIKKHKIFNFT